MEITSFPNCIKIYVGEMVLSIHSVKGQNLKKKKKMCNYAPEKNTQIQCNIKVSEIRTLKKIHFVCLSMP